MAIETLFCEGFDSYVSVSNMDDYKRWQTGSRGSFVSGRYGGKAYQMGTIGYEWNWHYLQEHRQLYIVGFAFRTQAVPINAVMIGIGAANAGFTPNDTGTQVNDILDFSIAENSSGYLQARTQTTVLATGTTLLQRETWYYCEFRAWRGDGTAGTYEVRLNEATEMSGSGVDLKRYGSDDNWGCLVVDTGIVDDIYVRGDSADTAGGWLGEVRVISLAPTSNGTNRDWTPSTGTDDWAVVDEMPPSAADYLIASVSSNKVTLGYDDLATGFEVKSVMQLVALRTSPVGAIMYYKPLCYSGSTNYTTAALQFPDSFIHYETWDTDPDTATDWTLSGFNSAEFGIELQ